MEFFRFDSFAQLLVAEVLQKEMDVRAVAVALGAILSVVGQPVFVFFQKLLEISGFFQVVPLLPKGGLEVFPFGFQHFGITPMPAYCIATALSVFQ